MVSNRGCTSTQSTHGWYTPADAIISAKAPKIVRREQKNKFNGSLSKDYLEAVVLDALLYLIIG